LKSQGYSGKRGFRRRSGLNQGREGGPKIRLQKILGKKPKKKGKKLHGKRPKKKPALRSKKLRRVNPRTVLAGKSGKALKTEKQSENLRKTVVKRKGA